MKTSLAGKVALVAGATRGAGRGIAVQLGAAGATVYVTGRTTRAQRSEMNRPETIEETAALVDAAGGRGIAVQVDHLVPDEVRALVARIETRAGRPARARERHLGRHHDGVGQDRLGVVAGLRAAHAAPGRRHARHHQPLRAAAADQDAGRARRRGDRRHRRVQRHELPRLLLLRPRQGGGELAWRSRWRTSWRRTARRRCRSPRAGCARRRCSRPTASPRRTGATRRRRQPHFAISESPAFVGRAVAALAADPDVSRWNGQSLSSGQLAKVYGFTDLDGSQPDAWRYLVEVQDAGKPADVTGYR